VSEARPAGIAAIARRGFALVRSPAAAVAAGIFGSRIVGLLRVRAFSYFWSCWKLIPIDRASWACDMSDWTRTVAICLPTCRSAG